MITHIDNNYFDEDSILKFPERLVLVGFIAADGCISTEQIGQNRLIFNISIKDRTALDIINKEIASGQRNLSFIKYTNSYILSFPSNQICNDLKRYNIISRKTAVYELPVLNKDEMRYFLRGYYYGDGCISKHNQRRGCYLIGTRIFCEQLSKYLLINNIAVGKVYSFGKNEIYAQFRITGREAARFSNYIFSDELMMLLPRKHRILNSNFHNCKWTEDEKKLLLTTNIDSFCHISGRTKQSVIAYINKYKLEVNGHININKINTLLNEGLTLKEIGKLLKLNDKQLAGFTSALKKKIKFH